MRYIYGRPHTQKERRTYFVSDPSNAGIVPRSIKWNFSLMRERKHEMQIRAKVMSSAPDASGEEVSQEKEEV